MQGYDDFERRYAGHVETGRASYTRSFNGAGRHLIENDVNCNEEHLIIPLLAAARGTASGYKIKISL